MCIRGALAFVSLPVATCTSTQHSLLLLCLQADREALSAQLSSMEDWLYDEGEDETKSVYVAKLAELKAKGGPIQARAAEDATRPGGMQGTPRLCASSFSRLRASKGLCSMWSFSSLLLCWCSWTCASHDQHVQLQFVAAFTTIPACPASLVKYELELLLMLPALPAPHPCPAPAAAIEQLRRIAEQYISLADSSLPAHAHLEAADRDTLRKEAGAALEWLNEKVALQAQVRRGRLRAGLRTGVVSTAAMISVSVLDDKRST